MQIVYPGIKELMEDLQGKNHFFHELQSLMAIGIMYITLNIGKIS